METTLSVIWWDFRGVGEVILAFKGSNKSYSLRVMGVTIIFLVTHFSLKASLGPAPAARAQGSVVSSYNMWVQRKIKSF